jgi:hypothetical protein
LQVVLYVPAGLVYTAVEDKVVFQSITAVPERLKLTEALALFLLPVSTLSVQFPISMFVGYAKCRPEICWFFLCIIFSFLFSFAQSPVSVLLRGKNGMYHPPLSLVRFLLSFVRSVRLFVCCSSRLLHFLS